MAKKSFKIRGGLADALDDTVSSAINNAGELHVEIIPLRKIALDQDNPRDLLLSFEDVQNGFTGTVEQQRRKNSEKEALASMVKSIESQGVINPVIVYKDGELYRLIAGERRTLASLIAKKVDIPAKVLTTKPDQLKLSLLQWIENIEREDLTLWERLRNLEKILAAHATLQKKEAKDITGTDLSQLIGCSLQQGANYRTLLNAPEKLRRYIETGDIKNIEKAAFIAKQSADLQEELIQACLDGNTLAELKKMTRNKPIKVKESSAGRPTSKINFGSTTNSQVARIIIDAVLSNKEFEKHNSIIDKIVWDNPKSVSSGFKNLIKLLEQA